MSAPVARSWNHIVDWLRENLPETALLVNPPAADKTIVWLETAIGYRLPPDLTEFLKLADGTRHRWIQGRLIPTLFNLIPVEDMLTRRKMLRGIYGVRPRPEDDEPAGSRVVEWLDAFLPIGESGTSVSLFVDLRPGELHGCVCEFSPEQGGHHTAPKWGGVGAMLEDVAEAMVSRRPALQEYIEGAGRLENRGRPMLPAFEEEDGYLRWDWVYED